MMTDRDLVAGTAELEKLAAELDSGTHHAQMVTAQGRRPYLRVVCRDAPIMLAYIYAEPADDGAPWFWWGWAERIAPVADIPAAARKIEQVLHAVDTR